MTPKQRYYNKNKAKHYTWIRKWQKKNYPRLLWYSARSRAKKVGLEFSLLPEDVVIPKFCPILGIEIIEFGDRKQGHGASIDRLDSSKGYTKDNIIVCSLRANMLKNNGTKEEFQKIISFLDTL